MAGIHADRGDTSHRIVSGETPEVGLRVLTNELKWGKITKLDERHLDEPCGWYCPAWHEVTYEETGHTISMNCDRLTTKMPPRL